MNTASSNNAALRVNGLTVHYDTVPVPTVAVNDISFEVRRGETLGLVGESGCGKSTTAMALLRLLHPPGRIAAGQVWLEGRDISTLNAAQFRTLRWRSLSLIPQGAMNALNPVMRIERQIADAIITHEGRQNRRALQERMDKLLAMVGLSPHVRRLFPHELSGGMKQRVCIAMAVSLNPALVIADEPTSALDVVVQRIVAQSLLKIKRELGNAMILIGHDMGLMAQLADRVAVMYAGHIVEIAPSATLFTQPRHPYTRQLIESVPTLLERKPLRVFAGGPPDLRHLPPGCPLYDRCPESTPACLTSRPVLESCGPDHAIACHRQTPHAGDAS